VIAAAQQTNGVIQKTCDSCLFVLIHRLDRIAVLHTGVETAVVLLPTTMER
jgi:hypothetical protein